MEWLMLSSFNAYLSYKKKFGNIWILNEFPLTRDFDASKKNLGVDCLVFQYKCYKKYVASDKHKADNLLSILNRYFDDIKKTGRKTNFAYCLDRHLPKEPQSGDMDRRAKSYHGVEAK
ncbi:MAG: hypothetical protein LBT43_14315 [Prevotella sp.]|nr:hypothetical protein [Prevotella sp.]